MEQKTSVGDLWKDFSTGLKSFIYSRVKNDQDADDILQEVFIKIHENIHTLKDNARIKPWLYQVTRNQIIDHFRNEKQNQLLTGKLSSQINTVAFDTLMDTALLDMVKMMDNLPSEYCEALCLTEIEGMSQKDYAVIKELSYSGAKSRVQRARTILKDMMLRCCHYQFDRYGTVIGIEPNCCCCCPP